MPNVQWRDIPFALETPIGGGASALAFNPFLATANPITTLSSQTGPQWILDPDRCGAGAGKRVTRDNRPQKGGEIIHRKFRTGLVMQIGMLAVNVTAIDQDETGQGNVVFEPACEEDLVDLWDVLMRHLQSIENAEGRLTWKPSGKNARMMDACRWLGSDGGGGGGFQAAQVEFENEVFVSTTFGLLCPFPYGMDLTQTETVLADGVSVTVNQLGTCGFSPVFLIDTVGTGTFFINNLTTSEVLQWTGTLPGAPTGGTYIEFDFFRETAYVDGDGANAKPGIYVPNSDFFELEYGPNEIEIVGSSGSMLWQNAWTG